MKNDLISINAAMKRFLKETEQSKSNCIHINTIKRLLWDLKGDMEQQPKTGGWIPCSERLPEKNQQVIYCDKCGLVGFALYTKKNTFWDNCAEFDDVLAWQPLPEPYKERD